MRAHLGQVHSLLTRRVSTSDDGQRLVPEDRNSSITHCTRGDTTLPVRLLSREIETAGRGSGCDDDCVGRFGSSFLGSFSPELERALGKVCRSEFDKCH